MTYMPGMSNDLNIPHSSVHHSPSAVDALVLGTVNAPYKRAISAEELARVLSGGKGLKGPARSGGVPARVT